MNNYCCTGRFANDPDLKSTQNGTPVCTFTLAVEKKTRAKPGEPVASFLNFVAWRQTAEMIGKNFSKGRMIAVEGWINTNPYEDRRGSKHRGTEIVVERFSFVDSKPTEHPAFEVIEDEDEPLPF